MFEAEDRAAILTRLKEYFKETAGSDVSSVEGTFVFDTLSANAKEFEKAYAEMDLIIDAVFPQTSWGIYLDRLAEDLGGLTRRQATAAIALLKFTGTAGATISAGSIFTSISGVSFATDEAATIGLDGTATAKATAQIAGAGGNVAAGTINTIPVSIYGVAAVTNELAAHDGYEEETDQDLLERLLFVVRQPATCGNVYHYIEWTTSVSGVGAVKILPLWNGNGTVKVVVVDANTESPSEELLQAVRDRIAQDSPVGAEITVVAPTTKIVDISITVTKGTGDSSAIKTVLTKYFKENVFGTDYANIEHLNDSTTISYAQVGRIILDNADTTGVEDYENLAIDGAAKNIIIPADTLPVVGTVTINAQT